MIIRRLGNAIVRQDWAVVVIELLVLVVGIFLGLQVDERQFLAALHEDIQLADRLSSRVRERRLSRRDVVISANEVLFGRADREFLTEEECIAVGASNYFNIVVSGLPSLEELIATGRLGIIRDQDLRKELMAFRETRSALQNLVNIQSGQSSFINIPQYFPQLIALQGYFDAEGDEIRMGMECDLEAMLENRVFLNHWGANADGYDAYVRDGLQPWNDQLLKVHAMVDGILGLSHE
jgi:hypothetical protein